MDLCPAVHFWISSVNSAWPLLPGLLCCVAEEQLCHLDSIHLLLIWLSVILNYFSGLNYSFKNSVRRCTVPGKACSFKCRVLVLLPARSRAPHRGAASAQPGTQPCSSGSSARAAQPALGPADGRGTARAAPSAAAAHGCTVMFMWCCCTCVCCERDFCEPTKVRRLSGNSCSCHVWLFYLSLQ